ncbi:SMP-30/gluconolactonase/LRE family protein, partial [Nocardia abscessus]|uniref:SMP-30/gluconolactonase/LRE family protein n=1 Tax=Nocardia abscessus TaxID=120957 RepID=UPI002455B3EA
PAAPGCHPPPRPAHFCCPPPPPPPPAAPGRAPPPPPPVAACDPAAAVTAVAAPVPVLDWAENLGYDAQGNLWVSRLYRNEVQRYDAAGTLTATVPVEFPGAVRLGPDGLLYVVYGDAPVSVVRPGGVIRFDPAAAVPEPEVFVSGLTMPNGAAFDPSGNLYVATLSGVVKVRSDGSVDTAWGAPLAGLAANGAAVHDGVLYVTANGGPLGRIVRIPLAAPADRGAVTDLSTRLPGLPDFADDLLVDPTGILYVTTLTGQLIRVDPATAAACAVLRTQPLTAVAATPAQPDQLIATTESGALLRVHLSR